MNDLYTVHIELSPVIDNACITVFDKIFSLDQIGSGQAIGEPLYFKLLQPCLKYCILSANIQYCMNNIGPFYFTVAPMWPKSYHTTGPKSTFLRHLVRHRTLSKTLACIGPG